MPQHSEYYRGTDILRLGVDQEDEHQLTKSEHSGYDDPWGELAAAIVIGAVQDIRCQKKLEQRSSACFLKNGLFKSCEECFQDAVDFLRGDFCRFIVNIIMSDVDLFYDSIEDLIRKEKQKWDESKESGRS